MYVQLKCKHCSWVCVLKLRSQIKCTQINLDWFGKNKSIWVQAHLAFWHIISYVKAHEVSELYAHKFQKISHRGINLFVYVGKENIHKYMQYEVSVTVCMGRIANQRKVPKWLLFRNYKSELLNI